jgi:hypothetical protein
VFALVAWRRLGVGRWWRPAPTPHVDIVVGGGAARDEISELCAIVA